MLLTHSLKTLSLRSVLVADAVLCTTTGLLMIGGATPLADLLDLPAALLRGAGLLLVPYVAFLVMLVRRELIPIDGVRATIGINLAWAAGCIALLFSGQVDPNGLGVAFVLVQIAAVLLFAEAQAVTARR